jgi:hypothetical protein
MTRGGWTDRIEAKCRRLTTIHNGIRMPSKFLIDYSGLLTTKSASPSHRGLQGVERNGDLRALIGERETLSREGKEREGRLFKTT